MYWLKSHRKKSNRAKRKAPIAEAPQAMKTGGLTARTGLICKTKFAWQRVHHVPIERAPGIKQLSGKKMR
jgi:hypothetical protein